MKEIDLSDLHVGETTGCEYYSYDGDLLLSSGTVLTQQHLDALQRRHITNVYLKDEADDDELHKILLAEFEELDELAFETAANPKTPPPPKATPQPRPGSIPRALMSPELRDIKAGQDGLQQLLKSKRGLDLDSRLKDGHSPDRPSGPALKQGAKQITASERTETYKMSINQAYDEAVRQTKAVLDSLADGENVDGGAVRTIVERFVRTFLTDHNMLLNISGIKPSQDDYLYHHSLNVCLLSINIAASSGYSEQQVAEIGMGALLHDVGMLLVPEEVRSKKGRLMVDEWFEIQKHPVLGLHMLEKVSRLPEAVPYVAYQLHERENGKGYPKQRSSRLIHCFAKIVQVADVYEALSSPRSYREAHMPYKAIELVIKMTRQGLLSGEFVKALLEYTSLFPVGSMVELSTGYRGKIVRANASSFSKPVVSILFDQNGNALPKERIFEEDLSINTSVQIVKALATNYGRDFLMQGF